MTAHRSCHIRRAATVAALVAATMVLTACGGEHGPGNSSGHMAAVSASATPSTSFSTSATAHNATDVSFAQGMIPHHRQAVQMADLAATRASSPQVKDLAAEIGKQQEPEIATMSGWLTSWGEQVPQDMPGMDHSGQDMPGMMGAGEMDQLSKASGKAFDTAFLQMMVTHHQGAITMAKAERSTGSYPPAKDMAKAIIASQSKEIDQMNSLLGAG
ncbi:DUF305 domain-containing protein [Sphaerisporangium viridialbum]|uniref:DUF305 domain-containing protein n=1 Tax=Sphaerisporangium viridialbum TaxID=46189 RepID=UPI003C748850